MTERRLRPRMPPSPRVLVLFAAGWACIAAGCGSPDTATAVTPTPPAAPRKAAPLPFADAREVDADALFAALRDELPGLAASPVVREEWARLRRAYGLADDPALRDRALFDDFVRVRLAFEATRAGGLWGLAWRITDQQPRSDRVWAQWRDAVPADALPASTAIAECDESSALFAVVAHGLGLSSRSRVGLFWPTSNHTVAVWAFRAAEGREVRVVVPTSQIFLDAVQSLDTRIFDPWTQPRLYDYGRDDAADVRLPAALARRFVAEARRSGTLSRGQLQALRNRREYDQRMAASTGREH